MKKTKRLPGLMSLGMALVLAQSISLNAVAHEGEEHASESNVSIPKPPRCALYTADRVFDGFELRTDAAVLIKKGTIMQVGTLAQLKKHCGRKIHLGDATILPGFIESHAHITFQNVNKAKVLEHGITTVQDTGGPLRAPIGGGGVLRLLSVGPILQAPGGYPLNVFGGGAGGLDQVGYPVASVAEAEAAVQQLVDGGATAIKIALELGGEPGAPWMQPHGEQPVPAAPWNLLSQDIVDAIVVKAHALGRRVIAHVGEDTGFARALAAGVDELAHMPCAAISPALLAQAANTEGVKFVSTVDTLSSCAQDGMGVHSNTAQLAGKIAACETATPGKCAGILYGSEIGHDNVPWGINGEEMHILLHLGSGASIDFTDVLSVFKAATSKAGENLGMPLLGTLSPNAPADMIAVRGNAFERFKLLEYPDLVLSGGRTVVNHFKK